MELFSRKEYNTGRWGRKTLFILIQTKKITLKQTQPCFYAQTLVIEVNLRHRPTRRERGKVTVNQMQELSRTEQDQWGEGYALSV